MHWERILLIMIMFIYIYTFLHHFENDRGGNIKLKIPFLIEAMLTLNSRLALRGFSLSDGTLHIFENALCCVKSHP